jgi:hypothetical protein
VPSWLGEERTPVGSPDQMDREYLAISSIWLYVIFLPPQQPEQYGSSTR